MGYPRLRVVLTDPHADRAGSLYAQEIDPVICNYRFELCKGRKCRDTPQCPGLRSSDHRMLRYTRLIFSRLAINDRDEAVVRRGWLVHSCRDSR